MRVRRPAVAGSWYPADGAVLAAEVDGYLGAVTDDVEGRVTAIVAPHAGLRYSGPVAAHAYRLVAGRRFDVAVLVGPSHFVGFDGVALYPSGAFETPFGRAHVDEAVATALTAASTIIHPDVAAHAREHSLEMQLPFLVRVAPQTPIVPLLMGYQTADTARALAEALAAGLRDREALLIASTDLSHYRPANEAEALDRVVMDHVAAFDAEGLQRALDQEPAHACGGGPLVTVMRAAHALGAQDGTVLMRADSGDISGDKDAVVGYLAAAFGVFGALDERNEVAA